MTPLSRVVHSFVGTACILFVASVANAQQSFQINDTEVTGSPNVRYGYEIWVMQNMESHKVVGIDEPVDTDLVETGPPMYQYQWSISFMYYPGSQVEGVFIKVYWKEGTGNWTYLKSVNAEAGD